MIIGVTGYGATGASACVDLLKEYENVQSFYSSFELQLLQQPDGLCDLKYFVTESGRRLDNSSAIIRFKRNIKNPRSYNINHATNGAFIGLTENYLNQLVSISWKGRSAYEPYDLRHFYDKLALYKVGRVINKLFRKINPGLGWPLPHKQLYSSLTSEEFSLVTKKYMKDVLKAAKFDLNKPILAEQVFNTVHPTEGMEFFDDAKAIIVDRDPRDVFIISNVTMKSVCGFMPNTGNPENFVKYYKSLHHEKINDPRVLYVQYEDLIYKYEEMIEKIALFTGLKHIKKGERFKPQHSINNTQQYLNYPELKEKIQYIETELKDYLYPFEENRGHLDFNPVKMKAFDRQIEADRQAQKCK